MGKKIKENKVFNPRNIKELTSIYLYEMLSKMEENIDLEKIIALFAQAYDTDIPSNIIKYLRDDIKITLQRLRVQNFETHLKNHGYTLFDQE